MEVTAPAIGQHRALHMQFLFDRVRFASKASRKIEANVSWRYAGYHLAVQLRQLHALITSSGLRWGVITYVGSRYISRWAS